MSSHPINESNWHEAYPAPKDRSAAPVRQISVGDFAELVKKEASSTSKSYLLVDVRRSDCESIIPGAINLPAHSLPATVQSLLPILSSVPLVIFHCNTSKGRGTRTAGWYADALEEYLAKTGGDASKVPERVAILTGGIKAWEQAYGARPLEDRGKPIEAGDLRTVPL